MSDTGSTHLTSGAPRSRLRVPPYAVTGGRTRVDVDIPFEALVRTTARGREHLQLVAFERRDILRLAEEPIAVAELSAHLHLPIGAIRVLVGDLSVEGHVQTKAMTAQADTALLERVRDGLRRL
ncbi:MAG: DUF742 domain-containing protein [Acidimicrobiales bacterium]